MMAGRDIRYGLRALRRTPAFTAGAVATIALTVGATTAIFSVVYGVLLRQLPYREVERVFWVWSDQPGRDRAPFNVPDFIDYRDSTRTLTGFAGFFAYGANLSDEAAAERVQGIRATGNLFDVLGARPDIGRLLRSTDERPGADHVVVLTDPFWRRRFGGDRGIIGRAIRLNGEPYGVVGVLAPGFSLPVRDVEFVLPFAPDQDSRRGLRNSLNFIIGVGRLADEASPPQATGELTAIARRLQERFPVENATKRGVRLVPAIDGIVGPFRTALLTLFAAVGAVLLIACANIANLMLSRALSRRKELALQLALGSSRWRVVRQVLAEALLIAIGGGTLGALAAPWTVTALVALAPMQLPRADAIHVDITILVFSLVAASLTGVLFGAIPALVSARVDLREALHGTSRGTTRRGQHIRGLLVSSEVALAFALLVMMTLLIKSFVKVQAVDPGFDPTRVLSSRLTLPAQRFHNRDDIVNFQRTLAQRLSALAAVTDVGAVSLLPLSGPMARVPFTVQGRPVEREQVPTAQFRAVSPGYFEAARIPLKRGRTFSDRDSDKTRSVAVVNEDLASRWLRGLDPIGARLLVDDNDGPPRPIEIVGVVGNVKQIVLDGEPTFDLYVTYSQIHPDNVSAAAANMFWIIRTAGDPMELAPGLNREVHRLAPDIVAAQVWPLQRYLSESMAPRRFSVSLMAVFGMTAMALAMTGIYAVILYSVGQRAREIAIRVALGAGRARIVRMVVGDGIRFVALGLIVGMAIAAWTTRTLSTMLFGLAATDAATFGEVTVVVAAASVLACAMPTARLGGVVPGSLRGE